MERKRIIINGKLKDIGYRLFLYENADAMDISEFYARNTKDGVEVLVGGKDVNKFADFTRKNFPEKAEVLEVKVEDYDGKIRPIESFAQSFMLSQMGKFVNIGLGMSGKQDSMLENEDKMLDKQDKTIGSIEHLREDMGNRFGILDVKYGEISGNLVGVIDKIERLLEKSDRDREEYRKHMDRLITALIESRKQK